MRIDSDTLAALRALVEPLDTDHARGEYAARRIPRADAVRDIDKRYRFDLFYAARGYRVLPEGVTDAHIDTALRRIVRPLDGGAA